MKFVLAFALMLSGLVPAHADGRADWSGYFWRSQPYGECLDVAPSGCLVHHAKWDWKRNQWVDIWYTPTTDALDLVLQFTNNDLHDADYVCVTMLFADAAGDNIAAYHLNVHSAPRSVTAETARIAVPAALLPAVADIDIGTRQCRQGGTEDDAVYAAVRATLPK